MNTSILIFKSESLRRSGGMDNASPMNILSSVLENIDRLTILWFPMIDELSGMCGRVNDDKLICINSKHSRGRQNFTIAHELYHLLYEKEKDSFICNFNSRSESERNADKFASYFLIPNIALYDFIKKHEIENWKLSDVIKCEQYFQISHTAMLCKLRREKLISFEEFKSFKNNVKRNAWNLGYDLDLYEPFREHYSLGNIIPLANRLYSEKKITGGKLDGILLDIFREDMVFNNLNEEDEII